MGDNELAAVMTIFISGAVTVTALGRAYFRARGDKTKAGWGGDALPASIDQRLARIEQAVDAVAIEVERISEGQRFTTRVLAERVVEPARLPESANSRGGGSHAR